MRRRRPRRRGRDRFGLGDGGAGEHPTRASGARRGRGATRPEGVALGPAVAGAAAEGVRGGIRSPLGAACGSAVSSGTAGLHLALRAVGVEDGTEVITSPFSFVASANVAVYERARPVFADIDPVTLESVRRRCRRGGHPAHVSDSARPHLRLSGRHGGLRAARTFRSSRTRARRSGRSTPTAVRSGAAAIRPCSASTRTSS